MESKINALLRLLSDPNERVARTIQEQLVKIGESTLPFLDEAEQQEPTLAPRLAGVREQIHFSSVRTEFQRLYAAGREAVDLEAGTFLIARLSYPRLDVAHYRQAIDRLAEEVRPRLTPALSVEQTIQAFNRYVFHEKGFRGNRTDYYDVDNSFLNRVIDRRTGIPITLSVLYLLLSRRLHLPVLGVGMPGHFVVKVDTPPPFLFVDCFHGGIFLREKDCEQFLRESGFGFQPRYLQPSSNDVILMRMLRNIVGIYQQRQEPGRLERFHSLIAVLEHGPDH